MKNKNQGLILITTLWIIVILSALSLSLAKRIHIQTSIIKNKISLYQALNTALSGLTHAINILEKDNDITSDSQKDYYYYNIGAFKKRMVSSTQSFSIKGEDLKEDSPYRYGINMLNSRLNINYLQKEHINRILETFPFDEDKLSAVFDWIDKDNDPFNNGDGAENDYYAELEIPYKAKNNSLTTWSELYLIKGMTNELSVYLKDNFTINDDGKVNINVAHSQSLLWLGFSDLLIEKIDRYLQGEDEVIGTKDDNHFSSTPKIMKDLNDYEPLTPDEASQLQKAIPFLTVSSSFFEVNVSCFLNEQHYPYELNAVLQRKEATCNIIRISERYY